MVPVDPMKVDLGTMDRCDMIRAWVCCSSDRKKLLMVMQSDHSWVIFGDLNDAPIKNDWKGEVSPKVVLNQVAGLLQVSE